MPTGGAAGDDRTGASSPDVRHKEARERAIMTALELIEISSQHHCRCVLADLLEGNIRNFHVF
jgi:hypothetical protein